MIARRAVLAAGCGLVAAPAFALDPGIAKGGYHDDDVSFEVTHSVALALDNAEGMLDRPNTLRLLLSDRELPPSVLCGLAFTPAWTMGKTGAVRGLLIEFDPADRNSLTATILTKPEGGFGLATTSLSNSEGLWSRLDVSATRTSGELKPGTTDKMAFSFSAPVFTNAVVSDLKGPAAAASEPVKALLARAEAIGRGDLDAAAALSTETAAANLRALPPEFMKQAPKMLAELTRRLKGAKRVVIRRETAAILLGPGEWASATLVDGAWKAAD